MVIMREQEVLGRKPVRGSETQHSRMELLVTVAVGTRQLRHTQRLEQIPMEILFLYPGTRFFIIFDGKQLERIFKGGASCSQAR